MTPTHEPSPEEIRQACVEIQAGWSEHERRKRAAWAVCEPVTVTVVEVVEVDESST